jgi:RNA polymerase sigma factor for flagellar operon FliA
MDDAAFKAKIAEMTTEIVPSARAEAYRVWQRAPHALEMDELEALALSGLAAAAHRWPVFCAEHGYDPERFEYFRVYCTRRMRGSILDHLRSQDWVTRSARGKVKALREAGQDRGLTEAQLAKASGLSLAEVRDTLAAVAARPVSIDAEPHDVAGEDDVEGQAVVSEVLAAVSGVVRRLGEAARVVLALHFYHGMPLAELASYAGVSTDEAARLHQGAVLEIHEAMVKVVALWPTR